MTHNRRQYLWEEALLLCNVDTHAKAWLKFKKKEQKINEHIFKILWKVLITCAFYLTA